MDDVMVRAVERVITAMIDNLGEPLTVDDMAKVAMFSKFHFSRSFQRVTGVSPARFLSALRLQRAKELLLSTSYNVADISLRVGYTSVGTFSTRFTQSVGLSPTTYRRLGGCAPQIRVASHTRPGFGTVKGTLWSQDAEHRNQLTFIGLFRERIPEGSPVACAILDRPGTFLLENAPVGRWYLLAHSVCADSEEAATNATVLDTQEVSVGTCGPITMPRDNTLIEADISLKPARKLDPPVLLALLDVRKAAVKVAASRRAAAFQQAALAAMPVAA